MHRHFHIRQALPARDERLSATHESAGTAGANAVVAGTSSCVASSDAVRSVTPYTIYCIYIGLRVTRTYGIMIVAMNLRIPSYGKLHSHDLQLCQLLIPRAPTGPTHLRTGVHEPISEHQFSTMVPGLL